MWWVQPRVLDLQQLAGLRDRIKDWGEVTKQTAIFVENKAHELVGTGGLLGGPGATGAH